MAGGQDLVGLLSYNFSFKGCWMLVLLVYPPRSRSERPCDRGAQSNPEQPRARDDPPLRALTPFSSDFNFLVRCVDLFQLESFPLSTGLKLVQANTVFGFTVSFRN